MRKITMIAAIATMSIAAAAPARAAQINFGYVLTDQDGKTIQDCVKFKEANPHVAATSAPECEKYVDVTVGRVVMSVLSVGVPNEDPSVTIRRNDLARLGYNNKPADIDTGDIEMIKDALKKRGLPTLIAAQVYQQLSSKGMVKPSQAEPEKKP